MYRSALLVCVFATFLVGSVIGSGSQRDENEKGVEYRGNILLEGKAAKEHKAKYLYYLSGYDYESRPVIVMEWGRWDIRALAEEGGDAPEKFEKSAAYFTERIRNGFFNKKANNESEYEDEIVAIIDFDGLNLRQIATADSLKLFMRSLAQLEGAYAQFAYGFIVNATPLVHQVIHASKPYMGKFLERMEIYGTNSRTWIPNVLKKIPRTQLHPAYGGKEDFRPIAVFSMY